MSDWSCMPGKPLTEVKPEVKEVIGDNLVIGFALDKQFQSLDMSYSNFKCYDFNEFYIQKARHNPNKFEPIGHRRLFKYFFNIDVLGTFQSCLETAIPTMRLYNEKYLMHNKIDKLHFDTIPKLPKVAPLNYLL